MVWDNSQVGAQTVAPGNDLIVDLSDSMKGGNRELAGLTVIRSIGMLRINSTDANLSADWVAGLYLRQQQSSLGLSVDRHPYMWWQRGSALPASGVDLTINFDVKSKRKLNPGNDLVFGVENNDPAQTVEFIFGIRVLWMLP